MFWICIICQTTVETKGQPQMDNSASVVYERTVLWVIISFVYCLLYDFLCFRPARSDFEASAKRHLMLTTESMLSHMAYRHIYNAPDIQTPKRLYILLFVSPGLSKTYITKENPKKKTVWKIYCHFNCTSKHRKIARHTTNYYFMFMTQNASAAQIFSNKEIPSFLKRTRVCMFFIASFPLSYFYSREKEIWRSYILMKCHATHYSTMKLMTLFNDAPDCLSTYGNM